MIVPHAQLGSPKPGKLIGVRKTRYGKPGYADSIKELLPLFFR